MPTHLISFSCMLINRVTRFMDGCQGSWQLTMNHICWKPVSSASDISTLLRSKKRVKYFSPLRNQYNIIFTGKTKVEPIMGAVRYPPQKFLGMLLRVKGYMNFSFVTRILESLS